MFADDVQTLRSTLTPGTPAFIEQKVVEEEDKIRLQKKNKPFITQAWEHYCISQNTRDQILPMQ